MVFEGGPATGSTTTATGTFSRTATGTHFVLRVRERECQLVLGLFIFYCLPLKVPKVVASPANDLFPLILNKRNASCLSRQRPFPSHNVKMSVMSVVVCKLMFVFLCIKWSAAQSPVQSCSDVNYNTGGKLWDVCASCAGVTTRSGRTCAYYACGDSYSSSCSDSSTSYPPCSPVTTKVTNSANCPVIPVLPTAVQMSWSPAFSSTWGLVSIGGVASLVIGVLVYSPLERLSASASSGISPPKPLPSYAFVHALSLASILLWFSLSALLAAPTVPWVANIERDRYTGRTALFSYFTAVSFETCYVDLLIKNLVPYCIKYTPNLDHMQSNPGAYSPYSPSITSAINTGIVAYVTAILALFPAATITGIAAYRLKNLLRHGLPAYSSTGCSTVNLVAAFLFSAIGSIAVIAVNGVGSSLVNTTGKIILNSGDSQVGLPGPVAAGLAAAFSVFGTIIIAIAFYFLRAIPGFGTAACGFNRGVTVASPLVADVKLTVVVNPVAISPNALPLGWTQHGPDATGDVWYSDHMGRMVWNLPGQ